jgi:hypothetical protein
MDLDSVLRVLVPSKDSERRMEGSPEIGGEFETEGVIKKKKTRERTLETVWGHHMSREGKEKYIMMGYRKKRRLGATCSITATVKSTASRSPFFRAATGDKRVEWIQVQFLFQCESEPVAPTNGDRRAPMH